MQIKNYLYRKPAYLQKNNLDLLDTIVIHHTGNNNYIDNNTDYHMEHNGWSWLGYGFYIHNAECLKVRGYKYQNAAVSGHNHHTINIAVQGDYNKNIPSQADIETLQLCINQIKKEVPAIKYIKRHSDLNNTTCCGKLFPFDILQLKKIEYVTNAKYLKLETKFIKLHKEFIKMKDFLEKEFKIRIR